MRGLNFADCLSGEPAPDVDDKVRDFTTAFPGPEGVQNSRTSLKIFTLVQHSVAALSVQVSLLLSLEAPDLASDTLQARHEASHIDELS